MLGRKAAYEDRRTVNAARSCSNHALVDGGGVTTKGDLRWLRFAGAGALAWETELMGATPAGARDARFYFLREHFLGGKQSI